MQNTISINQATQGSENVISVPLSESANIKVHSNKIPMDSATVAPGSLELEPNTIMAQPLVVQDGLNNISLNYTRPSNFWECTQPVTITVHNLSYTVPSKELLPGCSWRCSSVLCGKRSVSTTNRKYLLNGINMIARPGELLAIAGPSGGGKTTLLNILAMRSPMRRIQSGCIKFNGQSEKKKSVQSTINYIMAEDKLLPYLTVYETLVSASELKLPQCSKAERLCRIEKIIKDMSLQKCRNTYIGGEWRKGISTGELKRLSIGIELLDDPSVMILDEPTSGLDASLSVKIINVLLKEARKGRTVILTVHQPCSQVFELFDQFLLLSSGRVVYHGAAQHALNYFIGLGYTLKKDWNPSDFFLQIVSESSPTNTLPEVKQTSSFISKTSHYDQSEIDTKPMNVTKFEDTQIQHDLGDTWQNSIENKEMVTELLAVEASLESKPRVPFSKRSRGNFPQEVFSLWKRTTKNSLRNPLTAIIILLVQAMQGLILGGIFHQTTRIHAGDKPAVLIHDNIWNSAWVKQYNKDIEPLDNHPPLAMFEQGVDKSGSYMLWTRNTTRHEFQKSLYSGIDLYSNCVYSTFNLTNRGYFPFLNSDTSSVDANLWAPENIYAGLMRWYQLFDFKYTHSFIQQPLNLSSFTPDGVETGNSKFLAISTAMFSQMDPFLSCAGTPSLISLDSPVAPGYVEPAVLAAAADKKTRPIFNKYAEFCEKKYDRQSTTRNEDLVEQMIATVIGKPLIKAIKLWACRLTSCDNELCRRMNSAYTFIFSWFAATRDTIITALHLSGCLFFVAAVLGFSSYDALLTFPQERPLYNREIAKGLYRPSTYYLAKNIADLPFQLVPAMTMATIYYFLVGLDVTAHQYLIYFGLCALTCFCAYGFGYMVSAAVPRMEMAVLVAPLTLVIWIVLSGFFLRDGDIPSWISWFKYFSFYRWSFFSLVVNQFPLKRYFGTLPNEVILALAGVTQPNLIITSLILLFLGFGYRILGFIFLATTNKRVGLEC